MALQQSALGLAFILAIDNTYLYLNKNFYKPILDPKEKFNVTFAILSWIVIILGIQLLVLSRKDLGKNKAFTYGAFLGFTSYALWNCTNYAIYPSKWSVKVAVGDTLWGSLLTGTTALVMHRYF